MAGPGFAELENRLGVRRSPVDTGPHQRVHYDEQRPSRSMGCDSQTSLPAWPAGGQGQGPVVRWDPPALKASFDSSPDRVALFLGQVIDHLDRFGHLYTSEWAMVLAVAAVMEGKVAEWVANLYSDHAGEVRDVGLFLAALQEHFEDSTQVQQAEGEPLTTKQRGRPLVEYIREFRRLAGKVRGWPERLLVHQFKTGLDRVLRQACVTRGLPPRLVAWIQAATEIDAELKRDDRSRLDWPVR